MKKLNSLWIWPPGASGHFILKQYYGGDKLANNEYNANEVKWFPKYLNVSHAEYFLQAKGEYVLNRTLHEQAKKEILENKDVDYAWHWLPIHIKDFLDVKSTFFIHPQPEDMWYVAFLTLIKNKNTDEYNEWAQDLLFPTTLETLIVEYNFQLQELETFPSQNKYLIDYRTLFFDYNQETLDFLKLDKDIVQEYTEKNIELIKTFIKDKLNTELQDVFLNKLVDLQA